MLNIDIMLSGFMSLFLLLFGDQSAKEMNMVIKLTKDVLWQLVLCQYVQDIVPSYQMII